MRMMWYTFTTPNNLNFLPPNQWLCMVGFVGSSPLVYQFQKQITSIFQKHNINIKPAYTSKKVSDYFTKKSKCSEVFDANVIYKYTCSADQSISYIGETSRQIFRRITDHCGTDKNSAIF